MINEDHLSGATPADNLQSPLKWSGPKLEAFQETESRYRKCMEAPLKRAHELGQADIVVGIPFYNESDTLPHVIRIALQGLVEHYPGLKSVIVAAGSPEGEAALRSAEEVPDDPAIKRIQFVFQDELINGKGWSIRAIFEIADKLGADAVILEADLRSEVQNGTAVGLTPDWIKLLMEPIRTREMDMVVSRFTRYYLEAPVSTLSYPLLTSIYECPIRRMTGGQWGISHNLLDIYFQRFHHAWQAEVAGYGVDSWLATVAITANARICEANLGIKIHRPLAAKREVVLRQVASVLFGQIKLDQDWWLKKAQLYSVPMLRLLPTFGISQKAAPPPVEHAPKVMIWKMEEAFNRFGGLYEHVFSKDVYHELESLKDRQIEEFVFPGGLWADIAYSLLLAYAFGKDYREDDILSSLIPLYGGFMASFVTRMKRLEDDLNGIDEGKRKEILYLESEKIYADLVTDFLVRKPEFLREWVATSDMLKPPVPSITYREFIPGIPLVVPNEITKLDGSLVTANSVYNSIFTRHKKDFDRFVYDYLQVPKDSSSEEILQAIRKFMHEVEDQILPDYDLATVEGTDEMVASIFAEFPHANTFSLTRDAATFLLVQNPPQTLITRLGYSSLNDVLEARGPREVLALASWVEEREYTDVLRGIIEAVITPEHFDHLPIEYLAVQHQNFPSLVELRGASALYKLTGQIVVSNLHKGMGGEYPKLRYFTTIAKDIVESERFGRIWESFAGDRRNFSRKITNSLKGHWGKESLSAHNIFEDGNQRILVGRLREMANIIEGSAGENVSRKQFAEKLRAVADSYHLALTLPDGKFVTCSAWSWASYSAKGGKSFPSPLSVRVERDWASREFLLEYFKALGGLEEDVERKVVELMGQNKEWMDLAPMLLGTEVDAGRIIPPIEIHVSPVQPPAGDLDRYEDNPILKPIPEHSWESKYVLNAGAIWVEDKVYMVYRAFGGDEVSRLGLAISENGLDFKERLDTPIFEPKGKVDQKGCEDPRLTQMGDRIYMAYTAYDGSIAQIALASIGIKEFKNFRWDKWRRHGMVFPGFTDKDAALFPERFNGQYAILHRVDPHIWITFSPHLRCPWSRKRHRILAGSTPGMLWDGQKIGGGAQPIKTRYGWLLITHGVDYARFYRLGVMLLDLYDPSKLIYRSPNPILEPQAACELGNDEQCWVSNVVFSCGAVPRDPKRNEKILDADDELIVYYGASDSVLCAATATVGALIPENVREIIETLEKPSPKRRTTRSTAKAKAKSRKSRS